MSRASLLREIEKLEPALRAAFLTAVRDIRSNAQIRLIEAALRQGDIPGAIRAFNISFEAFEELDRAMEAAYLAGGASAVAAMPALRDPLLNATRAVVRFNGRNERAESWLRNDALTKMKVFERDQVEAVRVGLEAGLARGDNPRTTALNVAGRVNKVTGRRSGGLIGLTSQQADFVENARTALLNLDESYFERFTKRDRRLDAAIRRAMRDGVMPNELVTRAVDRYSDRLLKLRADTIARTETIAAFNAGRIEGHRQTVERLGILPHNVKKVWRSARDSRTRDKHLAMHGSEVLGLESRFSNGLRYPGDPSGPASEVINCRCVVELSIDFLAEYARA